MNVLLISQCDKRALVESRRILDQFAERRGERTWQTPITQAGLDSLRKLLKKSARRNTAVACHWIRGRDHSELLWIVGDASRFNEQGAVPTNTTRRDVLRRDDENDWHTGEDIRLLAQMAALFHDIGKANAVFQAKLRGEGPIRDAFRHEWVSLRLFEAFVGVGNGDIDWLQRLAEGAENPDTEWLARLVRDDRPSQPGPFKQGRLPPLAQAVGWLVLSHHRLPIMEGTNAQGLQYLPVPITADWNDARRDAGSAEQAACWTFAPGHLPFASAAWRRKVATCAAALLARPGLLQRAPRLLADPYVMHLSRMVLMLADHHYSSLDANPRLGDPAYPVHANTDREGLKQRLDEHLLGVARESRRLMGVLPRLSRSLPRIARHKGFKRRSDDPRFRWQDKAFDLAVSLREHSARQGFFGINLASTGCGKTLANGRILYALADPQQGARFTIALGLRTLTLQTGQAYRERLGLGEDDLAVLVGGGAVRQLFELGQERVRGSESSEALLPDDSHVHYESGLADGPLKAWLERDPAVHKLVTAPVLACTLDHLISATESLRGGKQIAPMLRLLTSDLVLDEPDDFDLADLPALSRLVHWAGMLGSRVLLSSATLPPALVQGLFEAYRAGRALFQANRGEPGIPLEIRCAWFDEFGCEEGRHGEPDGFAAAHDAFIRRRLGHLATEDVRRRARLVPLAVSGGDRQAICQELAGQLPDWMLQLHRAHHSTAPDGRRISVGLLRLANIEPLIELAQALFAQGGPEGTRLHLCVYHSRHPLVLRSAIERQLDGLLRRHDPQALFNHPLVRTALAEHPEADQVFVVLASPVAEVGRDHDYDWAVVEPSSMRSIIQLAGRIRRHRPGTCTGPNLYLLARNLRALQGQAVAFEKPGFECKEWHLASHDLHDLLREEEWMTIDAAPRIVARETLQPATSLVDLEHARLRALMLGEGNAATRFGVPHWWQTLAPLSGILQIEQRFRKSSLQQTYSLLPAVDDEEYLLFHRDNGDGEWTAVGNLLGELSLALGPRVQSWGAGDYLDELAILAERFDLSLPACAKRFGQVQLDERDSTQGWDWHPLLGFKRRR
ncbi:type I-F CRISPR-associated helicase Cas3f [Zestomonas carbonaria]|uniref:CRISPR-associated nuclease/helicase Cas3 subtype I-F/YPEST n=1 Tax=Zestomonas carbonaria TaxID=2762745 RepID=A0A7U7EKK6_9GAMM|nr:type I-F CRISPR-associated helicase Cas3f [Pseudomonas carbonaria]CAD5106714.1 CRISPR-associated nuclease/helicase Cas3 subtype I-F/YPEST [Pseudomonas carbonaria]